MTLIHLITLALIQGITEFLPVSSSGHLILVPKFLGEADQGLMIDVAAHGGTLVAVCLYFYRDVWRLARGKFDFIRRKETDDATLFQHVAIATIPGLIAGAVLFFTGEAILRHVWIIATASIVFGILLGWADKRPVTREVNHMNNKGALLIGVSQILAFIPGTSRSGITMTAARYLGFDRTESARFSMVLSIPLIAAAMGVYIIKIITNDAAFAMGGDFALVFGLSFLTAMVAIHLLMRWLQHHSFMPFVVYRILLGILLFALF